MPSATVAGRCCGMSARFAQECGQKPLAAKQMVSCAVQTDITWVKSDNPVRPKTPQPKRMQAGTQTSTPQQTPTKASQARTGRSSANKNPVEIVDGVAIQKNTTEPVRSASVLHRLRPSRWCPVLSRLISLG